MAALQDDHMKARIVRIGKAQGIRLSKALLKKAKLGDVVELRAELGRIVILNTGEARFGWAQAAQRMRARAEGLSLDAAIPTQFDKENW